MKHNLEAEASNKTIGRRNLVVLLKQSKDGAGSSELICFLATESLSEYTRYSNHLSGRKVI